MDEKEFRHQGRVDFIDNRLDSNSGTIRARAIFDNPDNFLTPGVFGRLRLFGGKSEALLIPDDAIASDQANKIVMTVDGENTVRMKIVTLGPIIDGLRVIRSGLDASDRVIVNGLQRARTGEKVAPQDGRIEPQNSPTP